MRKQIKIFSKHSPAALEDAINAFIESKDPDRILEVKLESMRLPATGTAEMLIGMVVFLVE